MESRNLETFKPVLLAAMRECKKEHKLSLYDLQVMTGHQVSAQYIHQILAGKASFETTLALAEVMPYMNVQISINL